MRPWHWAPSLHCVIRVVLVALEQAGHLAVGQQGVHALKEARVHHVRLVEGEAYLLVLAAGAAQHPPQVLVEVLGAVLVVHRDLEHGPSCAIASSRILNFLSSVRSFTKLSRSSDRDTTSKSFLAVETTLSWKVATISASCWT